ncbi:MAG: hypothetical protein LBV65_02835 [Desulfovibrio sp.]|jgi:hypothetical protein|nr:hypothetical protein [Desulfovibrio sp.]
MNKYFLTGIVGLTAGCASTGQIWKLESESLGAAQTLAAGRVRGRAVAQ